MQPTTNSLFDELARTLPLYVLRSKVRDVTFGAFAPQTMANYDARGEGPAGAVILNRKVAYPRDSFLAWIAPKLARRKPAKAAG